MIRLTTLENQFETDLITHALDEEGIEYVVKTFHDTAYDGIYETVKGFAMLLVEESAEDRAREIVDELRASVEAGEIGELDED